MDIVDAVTKNKMKTLILTLSTILLLSCGNASQASGSKDKKDSTTMTAQTIHLTKAEFLAKVADYETNKTEFKYLGDKPCIIDFYADWCGPCKTIAPILEDLAQEYSGKIIIYKVNTDKEQDLSQAFGIRSIPTLLFVPVTGQPQMVQGALPKAELKRLIGEVLLVK